MANTLGKSSPGASSDGFKKPELDEAVPARTEDAVASAVTAAEVVAAVAIELPLFFLSWGEEQFVFKIISLVVWMNRSSALRSLIC